MPGLQTFSLALFIHNIQITAGHAGPRIYIEHKPGKNLQSRTLRIYEEEIHVQGMKNGTIFCEIASYINRGDSLSFMCPEPIIKIHTRVIAYYCQDYSCLLSPMMNEARINGIDFLKLHIIPAIAINLWHFTSLSKHNRKVRKDKCLLEGKKNCIITASLSSTTGCWCCIPFNICMKNGIKIHAKEKQFIIVKICGRAIGKIINEAIYRRCRRGVCVLFFTFSLTL